ncbi:MAG: class I SAM-dependent methyltransferase family protein [DPANN group archaeon]|nr:class I SAM-dependent methyltransferase family protein [DPANN group archaeon]
MKFIDALKEHLTEDELKHVNKSFEVLGDIAIIDIPEELENKKILIAKTLKDLNKHINIILRKTGDITGTYRVGTYETLIGDRTETICKENGCRFKVDPTKTYFSSKMGYERQRITDTIKDKENILCLFAGIGPYPINIAKTKDVNITAIEINPESVDFFKDNIKLNKVEGKINIILGDITDELPKIKKTFDRVLMPAPKDAENFIKEALEKVKIGGIINIYGFKTQEKLKEYPTEITEKCKEFGYEIEIIMSRDCGNMGPYCYRVVCDFKVLSGP